MPEPAPNLSVKFANCENTIRKLEALRQQGISVIQDLEAKIARIQREMLRLRVEWYNIRGLN